MRAGRIGLPLQGRPKLDFWLLSSGHPSVPSISEIPLAVAETDQRTVAQEILGVLAQGGVRGVFGIPGGLVSPVYDALGDYPEFRPVHARHETMAVFQAMGHALVHGEPALVLTTGGPGLTNAITGIAAASEEDLPLIVIAGEVPQGAGGRGALQDGTTNGLDLVAMLRTVTRWSTRLESAASAVSTMQEALQRAKGPRPGPVFVSLPLNIGGQAVPPSRFALASTRTEWTVDRRVLRDIARSLDGARRPLIVAGNGARGAHAELKVLAERLAVPVVTTPHSKGVFPESHMLHLGGIGLGGHPSAERYIEAGVDVVLVVGSRLGDYATNGWSVPIVGSQRTIQIDAHPLPMGVNYPVSLAVVGDAATCLREIAGELPQDVAQPRFMTCGIQRSDPELAYSDETPLKPARVLASLQEAFPNALWMVDQGEHCAYALHHLRIDEPDQFRTMVGLASMGSGIGTAIGARHASRDRPVVGICGDGGFAMHAGEVLTCVEHGIDVILVIMNDGRWNMVHHGFGAVFGRVPRSLPSHVADLAGVAREFGALGVRIEDPEDLAPENLRPLASFGRPVVLDVRIDASLALSVESRSAALKRSRKRAAND